ncbi:predicted protein, partial [Scheffersomyces stipitis CBS 6054]
DQSRSCYTGKSLPFTGYRIENQINLKSWNQEYHLIYCNDNKLIYDQSLNSSIPWAVPFSFSNTKKSSNSNILVLARRKSFALREIPLFLPNTLVGALFCHDEKGAATHDDSGIPRRQSGTPLVAENFLLYWSELNYKLDFIVHIPLLGTPSIDSKRYNPQIFNAHFQQDWDKFISSSENYTYSFDSRRTVRKSVDSILGIVDYSMGKIKRILGTVPSKSTILWKLIILSKVLTIEQFNSLLLKLDRVLSYD